MITETVKYQIRCLLALFGVIVFLTTNAQTFQGVPVETRQLSGIKSSQVYRLNFSEISDYFRGNPGNNACQFIMGDQVFEWTLFENQMLSPDARGTTMRDGKYVELDFDRSCRTFIGYKPGSGEEARFTITQNNFIAMMPENGEKVFIQPLYHFEKNADRDLVVVFRESDLIRQDLGYCDLPSAPPKSIIPTQQEKLKKMPPPGGGRTFSCLELEVAFATDHRMFEEYDSVEAVLDFNLTVLNFVEPFYDDLDLDFWVQDFFIVTSTDYTATPWGAELDADILLDAFGDWADSYFGDQDIGHLWTSGDIYTDEGSGIIGRAWIGGACGDIGITPWSILERFSPDDFYSLALLQAHEYGHTLDADHEPNTGTIMEPSLGDVESASWAEANIIEMNAFIEDESCIQSCVQCPSMYNIIDYIGWGDWRYSAIGYITSSAIIDSVADVIFQSNSFITLTPGFTATSKEPASGGATFEAKIEGCE